MPIPATNTEFLNMKPGYELDKQSSDHSQEAKKQVVRLSTNDQSVGSFKSEGVSNQIASKTTLQAKRASFVPPSDFHGGILDSMQDEDDDDFMQLVNKKPLQKQASKKDPAPTQTPDRQPSRRSISPENSNQQSSMNKLSKKVSAILRPSQEKRKSTQSLSFKYEDFIGEEKQELEDMYSLFEPPLGSGLYGCVYRAKNKINNTFRAVKRIKRSIFEESGSSLELLLKDFHILKGLSHPNIIQVYEYFVGSEYISVVSELCEGGEMFDRIIQDTRFEESKAANYVSQILSAIAYCHSKKLAHCDLKPENIVFQSKGSDIIKIIDFGNSAYTDNKRLTNKFGTVYYIAPEVLRGDYDERCDIWSIGVILYILLSGIPPFNGKNDHEILHRVSEGQYSFSHNHWQDISAEAKDLISGLLKFKPEERLPAQDALNHPWLKKWRNPNRLETCPIAKTTLRALKNFRADCKLQEAMLSYLMIHLFSKQEQTMMLDAFMEMDIDGDGKLSLEDLLAVCVKLGKSEADAQAIAQSIMKNSDTRGHGFIDFSEFLKLSLSQRSILTDAKLREAFDRFDQSGTGFITLDDLKSVLNKGVFGTLNEDTWVSLLEEATSTGKTVSNPTIKNSYSAKSSENLVVPSKGLNYEGFRHLMQKYAQSEAITQSLTQSAKS